MDNIDVVCPMEEYKLQVLGRKFSRIYLGLKVDVLEVFRILRSE
jgi:hypothetical protein